MDPAELAQDLDLTMAATKIQASFRGHMARKQAEKGKQDTDLSKEIDEKLSQQQDKNPANQDEELLDVDLSDPSLNHAAIKIQAQFRGHMTRKTIVKE